MHGSGCRTDATGTVEGPDTRGPEELKRRQLHEPMCGNGACADTAWGGEGGEERGIDAPGETEAKRERRTRTAPQFDVAAVPIDNCDGADSPQVRPH